MAKIGLKNLVYKSPTSAGKIAAAIQANIAITQSSVKLYADDSIRESDKSFQTGTITLGVDDLSNEIKAELLGKKLNNEELISNVDDQAPFVATGFYGKKKVGGLNRWRAVWLKKVQFGEPSDENKTKEEVITFGTSTIVGDILVDENGDWKEEQTFETETEAIAYLNAKSGIKPQATTPVANIESGTYAVAQSVTLTAGNQETIYYTINGTTPSATNGTQYAVAIDITETCALRAIAVKEGYSDSPVATYEYIITT